MTKILVVDDERPIRSVLREILENEKYQVDDAENGKQAKGECTLISQGYANFGTGRCSQTKN